MVNSVHLLEFETLHNYGSEKDHIEVPVTLRSGKESVSFPAQLDTGATYCVFERTYAEILGLSVESGTPLRFTTAMGSFDAYGHTLSLETLGYSFDSTVYFATHEGSGAMFWADAAGSITFGWGSSSTKANSI
jgi:hypothetical protein